MHTNLIQFEYCRTVVQDEYIFTIYRQYSSVIWIFGFIIDYTCHYHIIPLFIHVKTSLFRENSIADAWNFIILLFYLSRLKFIKYFIPARESIRRKVSGWIWKKKKNVFNALEHWSTENMIKNMSENYLHINSEIFARMSRRAKNERMIIFYEFQRLSDPNAKSDEIATSFIRIFTLLK